MPNPTSPEIHPTIRWNLSLFFIVWLISSAYLGLNIRRGWVPHDEGVLGQSAERTLQGEMPHRDFVDPYTGGLAYVDAAAFRLFGTNLIVLRYVLFAAFLVWVPVVQAIARKFLMPGPAAAVTLVSVAWSVPNYPAAMPSWFCLFFATFGTLAILVYIRQPRPHWLIVAGLCGGFSCLIKAPGLYFVAGSLLFFVFREQYLSLRTNPAPFRSTLYSAFIFACLATFVFVLFRTVSPLSDSPAFLHFFFPPLLIAAFLAFRERLSPTVGSSERFARLLRMTIPFLSAVAIPLSLFAFYCARQRALASLGIDLSALNLHRFLYARKSALAWSAELPAMILALILTERVPRAGFHSYVSALKLLCAALFLASCFFFRLNYFLVLHAAWGSVPVLTISGILLLWSWSKNDQVSPFLDQGAALLLSVTVLCSLIQFPYASPIYFCYIAPLVVLTISALLSRLPRLSHLNLYLAGAFFALYAVLVFRPGFFVYMNYGYHRDEQTSPLVLPRATGLLVTRQESEVYGELIPLVQQLASRQPILAGPDCPEVYFLAGLKNPTPELFDFLQDPQIYRREIESLLDQPHPVNVVVVNEGAQFSAQALEILQSLASARFKQARTIGNFTVYWRP